MKKTITSLFFLTYILLVGSVQESIDQGRAVEEKGYNCRVMQYGEEIEL